MQSDIQNRRIRERHDARTGWAFMAPFFIMFLLVFAVPICVAIYQSFFRQVASGGGLYGGGELKNQFVGLENFTMVITSGQFWSGMGRVVVYAAFQIPIMIISALVLALVLDSFLIRRVGFFRLSYFLPFAIPGIVAAMVWLYIYTPELSPIVKFFDSLGIHIDFMAAGAPILASMANMTTWTYTGYKRCKQCPMSCTRPHVSTALPRGRLCAKLRSPWSPELPSWQSCSPSSAQFSSAMNPQLCSLQMGGWAMPTRR